MDKQKKEGNIKKEQPLPSNGERYGEDGGSARRWIEREIERERRWGTVGDGGRQWGRVGDSGEEGWERERVRSAREAKCWRELDLGLEGKKINPPDFPRPHLRDCGRGKYLIHDPHMQMWVVNNPRPQFHKVWS